MLVKRRKPQPVWWLRRIGKVGVPPSVVNQTMRELMTEDGRNYPWLGQCS
jgi:hypothetical protein